MPRRTAIPSLALVTCVLAGCGSSGDESTSTAATAKAVNPAVPRLAQAPPRPGEFVVSGETSPASHGPLTLDGRYLVRFEQTAPEDPKLDFSDQTPFTASLQRRAGESAGAVKLFGEASAGGRRELRLSGRYVLDVSFGDFPYAVRFTPR